MAYHETFWVVAGTAAPVIALAAVIQLRDGSRATEYVRDRLAAYRAAQGIPEPVGTPRERRRSYRSEKYRPPGLLTLFMFLAYVNIGVQNLVLVASLASLRQHVDAPLLSQVIIIMQFGLWDLALVSFGTVYVRMRWARKLDRALSETPHTTDRHDSSEMPNPRSDTSPSAQ